MVTQLNSFDSYKKQSFANLCLEEAERLCNSSSFSRDYRFFIESLQKEGSPEKRMEGLKFLFNSSPYLLRNVLPLLSVDLIAEAIEALPEGLGSLEIPDCGDKISAEHLLSLSKKVSGKTEKIVLSDLPHLTDEILVQFATRCPNLKNVCLYRNKGLTDAGIKALVQACPRLRHVEMSGCAKLTNRSIAAIKTHLESVSYSHDDCPLISSHVDIPLTYKKCKRFDLFDSTVGLILTTQALALRNEGQLTRLVAGAAVSATFLINLVEIVVRPVFALLALPFSSQYSKGYNYAKFQILLTLRCLLYIPLFFELFAKNIYKAQLTFDDCKPFWLRQKEELPVQKEHRPVSSQSSTSSPFPKERGPTQTEIDQAVKDFFEAGKTVHRI